MKYTYNDTNHQNQHHHATLKLPHRIYDTKIHCLNELQLTWDPHWIYSGSMTTAQLPIYHLPRNFDKITRISTLQIEALKSHSIISSSEDATQKNKVGII